ncbi:MAG: tetratricopeptide repeat protein [Bryobacteraceae bacterium]|nr:tetratricopeptide repeat protein [Bryobacteraceae bacterium]
MIRRIGLLTATLLLGAMGAWGQTASLEGEVKGEDGKPYQGKDKKADYVLLERTDIKGRYQTHVDKKGRWFHAGLPLGTYNITLFLEGKEVDKVGNVRTRLGDPLPINFDLQQMASRRQAMQAAAQTGQMTEEMKRDMSPEQKAALEKQMKERSAAMAKNKALNDAFNGGMEAIKTQQWAVAVEQFVKASEMDPKQHVIWAQLADSYVGLSKTQTSPAEKDATEAKAQDSFTKAIELKPDEAAYYNNLALSQARTKKFKEAEESLGKAAALDPAGAGKYYYNLGAILVNTGQNEPAGSAFKKAIELDPNYADAHYQYGIFLTGQAKVNADGSMTFPPGTKESFEKYLALKPDGPMAESAKGMLTTMGGKVETTFQNPSAPQQKKGATTKKKQ